MEYPHAHKHERLCLSALMRGGYEARRTALEELTPSMFDRYEKLAQTAFRLAENGRPDVETVAAALEDERPAREIAELRCAPMQMAEYASRVRSAYVKRTLFTQLDGLVERTLSDEAGDDLLEDAEKFVLGLGRETAPVDAHRLSDLTDGAMKAIEAGMQSTVTGVPTGFYGLDEFTRGWQPSDLIIIAGRTSMGKTSFTLSACLRAARDMPVAFVSLEMSKDRLTKRLLGMEARVSTEKTHYTDAELAKLQKAKQKLDSLDFHIIDTPGLTHRRILSILRRMQAEEGIALAAVDYVQKVQPPAKGGYNSRHDYLTDIAHGLKDGAKELDIPILLVSQINRGVEHRSDKRPMMSDLRESGSLEEAADLVCLLYRPEYYGETEDVDTGESLKGVAEFIIGKNRNGPTGKTKLAFVEEHAAFENLERARNGNAAPVPANHSPF